MDQSPSIPSAGSHPVQLDVNAPLKVARWRVIGNIILAIPHIIVLYVMLLVLSVLQLISWFAILFTGNIPRGIFNFMSAILRYELRVISFVYFLREPYPAFDFTSSDSDPGGDPATLTIPYPNRLSRGLIFVKWLLVIPHFVVLLFVLIAYEVCLVIGFFAVLITGSWPEGLRRFVIGTLRWTIRVNTYIGLMTDIYPPFSLQP